MRSHDQQHALTELWDLFLRYRWRFIVPAFVVAAAVLLCSLGLPRKYRATALFERRSDLVLLEMTSRGATRPMHDPKSSLIQEIAGRPAIDRLMSSLSPRLEAEGLITSESDRQALKDDLQQRLVVQWEIASRERDRIRVEYTGGDPRVASLAVNGLVDNYITRTRVEMDSKLKQSAAFFQEKVNAHRRTIEELENHLLEFEIENADLLPNTPNNLQTQLGSVQEALSDAMSQRDAVALRIQALRQALVDAPEMVPTIVSSRNPEIATIEKKISQLQQQLYEYTVTFKMTEVHPDVVAARSQIEQLKDRLANTDAEVVTERQSMTNPKRAELELQLTAAQSEHRAYSDQVKALQQQIHSMAAHGDGVFSVRSTHRKLNRELSEQQRQLTFWEDNLRRIDMSLAAESGNRGVQFDFIQPAQASHRPVSPNLAQVIAAAILLSGSAGALGVFLAYRSDDTFISGEALSREMGLPLFGSVSEIITQQRAMARRIQRAVLYPTTGIAMASLLFAAASLLYMDLENPAALTELKETVRSLVNPQPVESQADVTDEPESSAAPRLSAAYSE